MAPVPGQAVLLDREKGEKDASFVVKGERDVAAPVPAFTRRLDRSEGTPRIGRVGGPCSGRRDHLVCVVGIQRDRRLASRPAGRRYRHHVRRRRAGQRGQRQGGLGAGGRRRRASEPHRHESSRRVRIDHCGLPGNRGSRETKRRGRPKEEGGLPGRPPPRRPRAAILP